MKDSDKCGIDAPLAFIDLAKFNDTAEPAMVLVINELIVAVTIKLRIKNKPAVTSYVRKAEKDSGIEDHAIGKAVDVDFGNESANVIAGMLIAAVWPFQVGLDTDHVHISFVGSGYFVHSGKDDAYLRIVNKVSKDVLENIIDTFKEKYESKFEDEATSAVS
jgi:hypothetical protein